MTREDFEQLRDVGRHLRELPRIGLISPLERRSRRRFWRALPIGERLVFPDATRLTRRRWDLYEPQAERFDLLVASNVFMYSADPARWFANVLAACAYFLLIDLVRRQRGESSEFGSDGDRIRYAVGDARPRVTQRFDLGRLGDRVLGYRTYDGGANLFDDSPLHVIALIRGNLSGATTLDEHPPGVRSALTELAS